MTKKTDETNNCFHLDEDGRLVILDETILNELGGAASDGTLTYDGSIMNTDSSTNSGICCGGCNFCK